MKRTEAGGLCADSVGERVKVQGWIHQRRPHGAITFLNLRDRSGVVQVVLRPDEYPEASSALDSARLEWVIEVEGAVAARAPEAKNPDMSTGEVEIIAERAQVLSPADALPFGPEVPEEDVTEETRLRHRYLDLRRPELQRNLMLRDDITLEIRNFFHADGFVHVETPILTRSTPEGARDYLVPSRITQGSFYALPQSPQLFKQLLMVAGMDRYVQIARCFRDEDLRANRQPEFTQVDVEMSFPSEEDIYDLIERLFKRIFPIVGIHPVAPFQRLAFDDAMRRFGTDRPDLRFGLEIVDLTDILGESGFRAFKATVESGGVIRAIRVPGAAGSSRKEVEKWAEVARRKGAAGVLTVRRRDGGLEFQVKGVLEVGELATCAERLELEEGDLGLIVAGPVKTVSGALGDLRSAVGRQLDLVDDSRHEFVWITEFPLFEQEEGDERWFSCHHPFTAPREGDLDRLESDPGGVRARAYDIVLNGVELGGGSIRIHESTTQKRIFGLLGMSDEDASERFGFLLEGLRYGAPPHGGIALGLDRMVMLMTGASSLRDVIAFPKTTSATCLMTSAPSVVDEQQLGELGVAVKRSAKAEADGTGPAENE
jgi:aspartyl-tRNA synthetase